MFSIQTTEAEYKQTNVMVTKNPVGTSKYGANGSNTQQTVGILGERKVQELFDHELTIPEGQGYDGGFDLVYEGLHIDVKTMGRKTSHLRGDYMSNVFGGVHLHKCDVYVFASYNSNNGVLTICGWLSQDSFKHKAVFRKKGQTYTTDSMTKTMRYDNYEIRIDQMCNVDSIEELKQQLSDYAKYKLTRNK